MMKKHLLAWLTACTLSGAMAQQGLENVVVETYYISDANDATDVLGGSLVEGSVTYRIFMDLAPGWKLLSVFGNPDHELRIETTTHFFNNADWGELTGRAIRSNRLNRNTVALDSWVTLGSASNAHMAVLKTEDGNGSVVGGVNNNGGSAGIPGGLLVNNNPLAGIPLTTADGLVPNPAGEVILVSDNASLWEIFGTANSSTPFVTNNSAWAVFSGVTGPTASNMVLVAQITTNGDLSFKLNVQVQNTTTNEVELYVSGEPTAANQYFFPGLIYPAVPVPGCTNPLSCNYNPAATVDDGSCITPEEDCTVCNEDNDGLILIDSDGDGVCDANEIAGCTDPEAVNYNPLATDEDGSCEYVAVPGCTNPLSCNYNPLANVDDGSCITPEPNCTECNSGNDGLVLIDTDGDGVCDANEIPGCQSPTACNYNPLATDDDGSCLEPVESCFECNGTELVIIDADGDGVCDADEIPGCTNPEAINYNPLATEDDGSCILNTQNQLLSKSLRLYPNPTFSAVTLEISAKVVTSSVQITLITPSGVEVGRFTASARGSESNQFYIETQHVAAGIYYMRVELENTLGTVKFVKF